MSVLLDWLPAGLELRDPLFLLAALFAPLVYWLASRLPAAVTYSSLALMASATRSKKRSPIELPTAKTSPAPLGAASGPRCRHKQQ